MRRLPQLGAEAKPVDQLAPVVERRPSATAETAAAFIDSLGDDAFVAAAEKMERLAAERRAAEQAKAAEEAKAAEQAKAAAEVGGLGVQLGERAVQGVADGVRSYTGKEHYKFGDVTEETVHRLTGKDDYKFGDLTKGAASAAATSAKGATSAAAAASAAATSAAADYKFGDLTKGAIKSASHSRDAAAKKLQAMHRGREVSNRPCGVTRALHALHTRQTSNACPSCVFACDALTGTCALWCRACRGARRRSSSRSSSARPTWRWCARR